MNYPRPLAPEERRVLEFLLSPDDDRLAPLRSQATTVTVTGKCECGCPTIYLTPEPTMPAAHLASPAVEAHSRADLPDPLSGTGLILFLEGGRLSSLELWYVSESPPTAFPKASDFDPPAVIG